MVERNSLGLIAVVEQDVYRRLERRWSAAVDRLDHALVPLAVVELQLHAHPHREAVSLGLQKFHPGLQRALVIVVVLLLLLLILLVLIILILILLILLTILLIILIIKALLKRLVHSCEAFWQAIFDGS